MNQFGYVVQVWLPLIVFQQVDAPRFYKGWVTVSVLNACLILAVLGTWWLQKREDQRRKTDGEAAMIEELGAKDYEANQRKGDTK